MTLSNVPETDILITAQCWQRERDAEAAIHRAIEMAATMVDTDTADAELAIMLTDDAGIRTLNKNWRGIDKATNVLSFPALQPTGAREDDDAPRMLGDIAIAFETVAAESVSENKAFADHLAHLAVHGYLHLVGFDHETDDEATQMENLETRILSGLGIADPDVDRVEITVEIASLKLDKRDSVSGREDYVHLYTTSRKFPAIGGDDDYEAVLNVPIEYRDAKVLHTGDEVDLVNDFDLGDDIVVFEHILVQQVAERQILGIVVDRHHCDDLLCIQIKRQRAFDRHLDLCSRAGLIAADDAFGQSRVVGVGHDQGGGDLIGQDWTSVRVHMAMARI